MHDILLTICARGGSKGVKNKNIRPLHGQPLIAYTIKLALDWGGARQVVVSTDSEAIRDVAIQYGAQVPFVRPAELSTDQAAKLPVIKHALMESENFYGDTYDIVVDLDPTAPVRTVNDLNNCLDLFLERDYQHLFSVVPAHKNPYFNMVEIDAAGRIRLCKELDPLPVRRQDAPEVFSVNASIYIYSRSWLMEDKELATSQTGEVGMYIMDDYAGIDIDREVDFRFVEFLTKAKLVAL